jgi:FAD synthase
MQKKYQKNYAIILTVAIFLVLFSASVFAARIGIYPGSFDPVHLGHLEVARSALIKLKLDAVFLCQTEPIRENLT